jgi:hypothetical protein
VEGERIATALGQHKAVIMRNHGLLTVGHSVDEAVWFITMERSATANSWPKQRASRSSSTPKMPPDRLADRHS